MAGRLFDLLQVKKPVDTLHIEQPSPTLDAGEIILVDNVADYYFDYMPDDYSLGQATSVPWDYDKHYPFVSPPFEEMWFEFHTPKIKEMQRVGVRVEGREMNDAEWARLPERLVEALVRVHGEQVFKICKWVLLLQPYSEMTNGKMMGPYANYILGVDENGGLAKTDVGDHIYMVNSTEPKVAAIMQPILINPVLMAISFMHVKNADLVRQAPVTPTTKHAKRKAKKNPPTSRYYVLKIDAIEKGGGGGGTGGGGHGGGGGGGGEPSLHIVRGHFADYSNGAGLFGKYKGRYWVSSHLRGNPEVGVTEKDYSVR